MNEETPKQENEQDDEMRPEYDFATMPGGVRGKYYTAYREGHTIKIHEADGSTTVQHFILKDGAVMLEPGQITKSLPPRFFTCHKRPGRWAFVCC